MHDKPKKRHGDFLTQYTGDIFLPNMLYGALVRSPKKSGRIRAITLPTLPDDYAYFCAEHISGKKQLSINGVHIPVFAETEVTYQGEPIGIIVGKNEAHVCSLRDETIVDIEEKPPLLFSAQQEQPCIASRTAVFGDPDNVSKDIPLYKNSFLMKPKSILDEAYTVIIHCGEKTVLYAGVYVSAHLRSDLAAVINVAKESISVHKTISNKETLNGNWQYALLAAQAGIASMHCKKPVKIALSRMEQNLFCNNASVPVIRHRTAVTPDGEIICMDISIYLDGGVYSPHIQTVLDRLVIAACGIYAPKNARVAAHALKTNNPPADFSMDYSDYQAFFAVETQIRHIAYAIPINPVEMRKKNRFHTTKNAADFFCQHEAKNLDAVINQAVAASDYKRKYTAFNLIAGQRLLHNPLPLRGMGFAAAFNGNGSFNTAEWKNKIAAKAVLDETGVITLFMPEPPPSVKNILLPIIKQRLSNKVKNVVFSYENQAKYPLPADFFTANTGISIQLVEKICVKINELAEKLPLPITVTEKLSIPDTLFWDEISFSGKPYISTAWGAAAAEIEIDTSVYETVLRGVWLCIDAGKIYNEKSAIALIRRSVDRVIDIMDIKRTSSMQIHLDFIPSEESFKEFAGIADNIIPAAVFNAVSQAVMQSITAVPLDQKTLYAALTVQKDSE